MDSQTSVNKRRTRHKPRETAPNPHTPESSHDTQQLHNKPRQSSTQKAAER